MKFAATSSLMVRCRRLAKKKRFPRDPEGQRLGGRLERRGTATMWRWRWIMVAIKLFRRRPFLVSFRRLCFICSSMLRLLRISIWPEAPRPRGDRRILNGFAVADALAGNAGLSDCSRYAACWLFHLGEF
jgi:hypothetical protein